MKMGLSLRMIGQGLSWEEIDVWLHNAPVDSAVHKWGLENSTQSSDAAAPAQGHKPRKTRKKQKTPDEIRADIASRWEDS